MKPGMRAGIRYPLPAAENRPKTQGNTPPPVGLGSPTPRLGDVVPFLTTDCPRRAARLRPRRQRCQPFLSAASGLKVRSARLHEFLDAPILEQPSRPTRTAEARRGVGLPSLRHDRHAGVAQVADATDADGGRRHNRHFTERRNRAISPGRSNVRIAIVAVDTQFLGKFAPSGGPRLQRPRP